MAGPWYPQCPPWKETLVSVKHVSRSEQLCRQTFMQSTIVFLQQILTFSLNFLKKKKDNMINLFQS